MSSRDSTPAGIRPNHPATAASSWPGKIHRTSRLGTPPESGAEVRPARAAKKGVSAVTEPSPGNCETCGS